jgi:hypothetical protein
MTEPSTKASSMAEFLDDIDSHGIYDEGIFEDLPDGYSYVDGKLYAVTKPGPAAMPVATREQTQAAIEARGVGGHINADAPDRLLTGWEVASSVSRWLLGYEPDAWFHGRGSRHRACVKALKEAGL